MAMFVPSFVMPEASSYATSPFSSIYDSEKSDFSASLCEVPVSLANPYVDDLCGLDENLEDSTLKSFLTPAVMSSLKIPARETNNSEFSWSPSCNKTAPVTIASCSPVSYNANPTLAQLNADGFTVDDILDFDQQSSKQSDSSSEFFSSGNKTPMNLNSMSQFGPSPSSFGSSPVPSQGSTLQTPEAFSSLGNAYMKSLPPMKNIYPPPRQSNPPIIGVVAPVKQPMQVPSAPDFIKKEEKPLKRIFDEPQSSPNLLEHLLCKPASTTIKVEPDTDFAVSPSLDKGNFPIMSPCAGADLQAQIVPNSDSRKREIGGNFKAQPYNAQDQEDFNDEKLWQDIVNLIDGDANYEKPAKRQRRDSGSSGHVSNDDDADDDDDNRSIYGDNNGADDSDDDMSDIDADLTHVEPGQGESLIPQIPGFVNGKKQTKPIQYFWQYNVQAKGPKGTRLKLAVESPTDPHVLNDFEDPVFDECNTSIAGIRHGGKARKGDGNEITPNPRKLYLIGLQLARLNRKINACCQQINGPSGGISAAQRSASRREKNKLASRACRLKKKAQHEANKIKLHGLALEHSQLNAVSTSVWEQLRERVKSRLNPGQAGQSLTQQTPLASSLGAQIDQVLESPNVQVAGKSIDYVNSIILKVEAGVSDGGLNISKKRPQKSS